MSRVPSVIVIGAGLSGLTAAHALQGAGWDVQLVEARDRVGGRTWSRQLPGGAVAEMGAEFILPGNPAVRSLASELGLGLWDKGVRYGTREPRGGIGTDPALLDAAVTALDDVLARLDEGTSLSASELLASLDIDPGAREVLEVRTSISAASPADSVPARGLSGVAHVDEQPSPSIAGGNQMLSAALSDRMEGRIRLSDPVRSVSWTDDSVEVETVGARTFSAERSVVSVPASVIGQIEFRPGLPPEMATALAEIRYGHAAKLLVPLTEPAPVSAVLNVPEGYWCWTETGIDDEPVPLVSCFAGSVDALDSLKVTEGPGHWLRSLALLRPELPLEEDLAILSTRSPPRPI